MKVFLIALFFCTISALGAQQIEFETKSIDYGTLKKGALGKRFFVFTNKGNKPLIIQKVNSECGCTIPEKPKLPILPGKKGQIAVQYDTQQVGPFTKSITVQSNALEGTTILRIKGEIIP